jgi:hypothetical protein
MRILKCGWWLLALEVGPSRCSPLLHSNTYMSQVNLVRGLGSEMAREMAKKVMMIVMLR